MAGHDGYTRYTLRIPDTLYERVKAAAGEKSVNAEIIAALEEAYPPRPSIQEMLAFMEELKAALSEMDYPRTPQDVQMVRDLHHELQNLQSKLDNKADTPTFKHRPNED